MFQIDEDYRPNHSCPSCTDISYKIDDCREFVGELVKQLYTDEPLVRSNIEFLLEELCHKLDLKYPGGQVSICRYKRTTAHIEMWKDYNNEHLNQLAQ